MNTTTILSLLIPKGGLARATGFADRLDLIDMHACAVVLPNLRGQFCTVLYCTVLCSSGKIFLRVFCRKTIIVSNRDAVMLSRRVSLIFNSSRDVIVLIARVFCQTFLLCPFLLGTLTEYSVDGLKVF